MVDGMVDAKDWQLSVRNADNELLGFVTGYTSLRLVVRHRRGGTWVLQAPEGSGAELLQPKTRLQIRRRSPSGGSTIVAEGYVNRLEDRIDESGRLLEVSGITDTGLLTDRLTLPAPWQSFNAQTADAYWSESGPAEFLIHRLVCRNAGMGAQGPRQQWDSRVGTSVRGNPQNGGAGWTDTSDGGVTWAGQTATIPSGSSARLRMTDALDLSTTDMATAVANVTVNGSCTLAISAYFNSTAAGAAPGQAGVVTETSVIHSASDVAASTLWVADAYRSRNAGKGWVRLEVGVQASGATRTATFNTGGGVWQKVFAGSTVKVNTRFKNLAQEVEELARAGNVSIYSDTLNGMPRLLVRAGVDKSGEIRLSRSLGNVLSHSTVLAAPEANVVLVAGEGEGTARVTRARVNTSSLTEWGRRIEKFRDARDVDAADTALLDQRGDEELAESARVAGWLVEATDNTGMQWPDDYQLGDVVAVVTREATSTDVVAAVEVLIDVDGVSVQPVLGSAELADNEPGLYAAVRELRRRLDDLEGRF